MMQRFTSRLARLVRHATHRPPSGLHRFTDEARREWVVRVNVGKVRLVKQLVGVDLLDRDGMARVWSDPVVLADVAYVLCKEQADWLMVSSAEFGEGLAGPALDQCHHAVMEALVDFFRRPADRKVLREAMVQATAAEAKAMERAEQLLKDKGQTIGAALAERLGLSSTSAPASSA